MRLAASLGTACVLGGSVAAAQPVAPSAPTAAPSSSAPSPSATPSSAPDDAKELARDHFARGLSLFAEEAWDAALAEFEKSRALYSTRNATKNAAVCLRMLHRFDEALELFETLLRDFPGMPPDARAQAEKEVKSLTALVGTIELHGGEKGAAVFVDGRKRATLPAASLRISIGTHVVRVIKEGFLPFEAQVQVASGKVNALDVEHKPLEQSGRLRVAESSGKVLDVLIDGVVVGKTPWEGLLPVGEHVVVLDGEGSLGTQPVRVSITLGQLAPLSLTAEPLEARVRIEPDPILAAVSIDGVVVSRGVWEGKLRVGSHTLGATADGFLPGTKELALAKADRKVIALPLARDPKASLAFKEAEAARQAWLAKRGGAFSWEVRGQGILLLVPPKPILTGWVGARTLESGKPRDEREPQEDPGGGGAAGFGVRLSYLHLMLPDPSAGDNWWAFRVGSGFDVNLGYWFKLESRVESTTHGDLYRNGVWSAGLAINVPLVLGVQYAIGSFAGNKWKGAAVGLAYTPTWSMLRPKETAVTTSFRLAGFEAFVDILDRGMDSKHKTALGKVFVFVLPPVGDEPLMLNFGGGGIWY